ncbi:hypothetical protein L2E82_41951 [Cichorium intybus]|uniref:Uncharacterized protein n=1 Tax=Cichorium intybus TaxID=13427 RepID=A0ACB8ZME4_CICIN|nr:hypothetical protein L2E82_41951 [Cichorium intybus]
MEMPKTPMEKSKTQTPVEVDFVSIAPLVAAVNSTTRRRCQQHHSSPLTLVFLPTMLNLVFHLMNSRFHSQVSSCTFSPGLSQSFVGVIQMESDYTVLSCPWE